MSIKSNIKLNERFSISDEFDTHSFDEWKEQVIKNLKGSDFEQKLITKTYERINLQPIYTGSDLKKISTLDEMPGFGTHIRGSHASCNLNGWEICQNIPYPDAEELNTALKNDLSKGQTAINISLDSATQLGIDSDYAEPEQVGDKGLAVSAIRSLSRAFDGIDIAQFPLYVDCGFSSLPFLMMFTAYARQNEIDLKKLKGSIEADPLGYLASNGLLPISKETVFDEMKTVVEWVSQNAPGIKTISVKGTPYHNAGASAVQELAFVMATAVEYVNQLIERRLKFDDIAKNVRLTFGVGPFYFMEIAKLRAARLMWSNIAQTFGCSEKSKQISIHSETSSFNQTILDPHVNMLRTTTEAFSAVVGGTDSLHTNSFDSVFSTPNQFSRRIARNTQIILNEESHLNNVIDPAGGSYYVESLTNEIAQAAWKEFQNIDKIGGMLEALQTGYVQKQINETYEQQMIDIRKRKKVIVGTNMYSNPKEKKIKARKFDHAAFHKKRSEFLQRFRVACDLPKNEEILKNLESLSSKGNDVVGVGVKAFSSGATLGEVASALRSSAGDKVNVTPLKPKRASEEFENLRTKSEEYEQQNGYKPKVFLATMGSHKQFKTRADFSRGFFEVGGFEVIYPNGFNAIDEAVNTAIDSGAEVLVICSTDEMYPELVPAITKAVKEKSKDMQIVLAGYPKDQVEQHKKSGIDHFIYLGCDVIEILQKVLEKISN